MTSDLEKRVSKTKKLLTHTEGREQNAEQTVGDSGREANGVCPGHCAQWALKDKNISSQHCLIVTPTPSSWPDLERSAWSKWYRKRCLCLGAGALRTTSGAGCQWQGGDQQGQDPKATWLTMRTKTPQDHRNSLHMKEGDGAHLVGLPSL